ncbi:sodium:solute symporter family protein [Desulfoluna spongiiphila]|uniref:Solute:Na+ symporter, SSS family/sodium/proline symporter n=1 Tax=Desulfoluna spongiiphila TaxID=419481 RepID=A0A1G5BG03_9BACT|nr:sodium:solute symporter family protein [Desulfoluna spongiiphila]SCX89103.1 solute:Na+ symporter, SSS family/sodium/proline symporter [Desulfoluna spongiiphila]
MGFKVAVIAVYAAVIAFVGIINLKKSSSFGDFFLGGRAIGPWMSAFTYATAYFSAVLFIGFAGKIGWGFGYSGLWIALGNAFVGVLGVWYFMGSRIRRMTEELCVHTMPEFFEARYKSPAFKLLASCAVFVFFIPYTSAVFMGLSYLFQSNFQLPYTLALVLMGGFTALYMSMGGYRAMASLDVLFGMIMLAGVLTLLGFTVKTGGGFENLTASLAAVDPRLTAPVGPPGAWPLFCLVFLTSAAPFCMPQLVQKFYAIRDDRAIKVGMVASTFFALLIGGIAYFTGATARVFLTPANTPGAFKGGKPLFDALMPELLANVIPDSLSVLMLLLVLSASMSTLAALVLISSSSLVKDIYQGFINKDATEKGLTRFMRGASIFFVVISVALAWMRPATIVAILGISWGAIGSLFLGPFIWGLFVKGAPVHGRGAMAAALVSLALCLGLYATGTSSPEAGTLGMLCSLAATPLLGLLLPEK